MIKVEFNKKGEGKIKYSGDFTKIWEEMLITIFELYKHVVVTEAPELANDFFKKIIELSKEEIKEDGKKGKKNN